MPIDYWKRGRDRDIAEAQRNRSRAKKKSKTSLAWMSGPLGLGKPFVMPFGKHRGKTLDLVPDAYLEWALAEASGLSCESRTAIQSHLKAKQGPI